MWGVNVTDERKYYTPEEAALAGYTLEPIKCKHCDCIGETTYDSVINDYYCAMCGNWQFPRLN